MVVAIGLALAFIILVISWNVNRKIRNRILVGLSLLIFVPMIIPILGIAGYLPLVVENVLRHTILGFLIPAIVIPELFIWYFLVMNCDCKTSFKEAATRKSQEEERLQIVKDWRDNKIPGELHEALGMTEHEYLRWEVSRRILK